MSVNFKSPLTSANTNSAFVSRTQDTSMIGQLDNQNSTDASSTTTGAIKTAGGLGVAKKGYINQVFVNSLAGSKALISSSTKEVVESTVTDAELEELSGITGNVQNQIDAKANDVAVVHNTGNETVAGIKTFTDDTNFGGNVVISGDLTVNGTTTTINTQNLDVEDKNVTINKNGSDATAEGAGLSIDRTGVDGSIIYQNSLASRWKAGDLGSESEVITASTTQILTGEKTVYDFNVNADLTISQTVDSTTTGSSATVPAPTGTVRLTNASLVSIASIDDVKNGKIVILTNRTGAAVDIKDNAGSPASLGISTGTGNDFTFENNSSVLLSYDSIAQRWFLLGGTGSGSGGGTKNYLTSYLGNKGNGNFESNSTNGWSLFNTTLTSGIPTGSITAGAASITNFAATATGKLAGKYSLNTASSAAWAAGQGFVSDAFTIDAEDQAKVIEFKGYYAIQSGAANGNFSGTSSNTFAVYIYDVTNSAWIQPAGVYSIVQSSGAGILGGTFQTTSNSTQYRLAIVCVNASAGAISINWDDFSFGPQVTTLGGIATDWQPYTPTISAFGTTTNTNFFWRRVGDSIDIKGSFTSGTSTASQASISLPSGLQVSAEKASTVINNVFGVGGLSVSGDPIVMHALGGGLTLNFGRQGPSSVGLNTFNGNQVAVSTQNVSIEALAIPITGFGTSSPVLASDSSEGRVVAAKALRSAGQSLTHATETTVDLDAIEIDTLGSIDLTANTIKVIVSGVYRVSVDLQFGLPIGQPIDSYVTFWKNGSPYATLDRKSYTTTGFTGVVGLSGSVLINLVAGDVILFRAYQANALSGAYFMTGSFELQRVPGNQAIAASETVAMRAVGTATGTLAASYNKITWPTVQVDTHGRYSSGTYTISTPGLYEVSAQVSITGGTITAGNPCSIQLRKSGSAFSTNLIRAAVSTGNGTAPVAATGFVRCVAGDTIEAYSYTVYGTPSYSPLLDSSEFYFQVKRIGN